MAKSRTCSRPNWRNKPTVVDAADVDAAVVAVGAVGAGIVVVVGAVGGNGGS